MFAHRGSSHTYAEHTLDAYLHAIEEGADGLECDVRLTRDGHLVCLHDRRLDRTSDGRGRVSLHTLAELDRLDFGSWHSAGGHSKVLTLDHLLSVVVDAGRPLELLIETKHPSRYGSAVEASVVALLRKYNLMRPKPEDPVQASVMSFSPTAIRRMRQAAPEVPTVTLIDVPSIVGRTGWLPFGSTIGGPGVNLLRSSPQLAHRLHRHGHRVFVWTVNQPDDLDLVLSLKVEGIISDRPGFVISHLRSLGLRA